MTERLSEPEADLQFERAEFAASSALACAFCKTSIGDVYFDVNGHVSCPTCRDRLAASHGPYAGRARLAIAALYGVAAAAAGALVWYAVREITHLEIGLIAIGIGILVGTAVRRGARGRGGLAYQALAVGLTYLAIVSPNAPYVLKGLRHGLAREVVERTAAEHPDAQKLDPDSPAVTAAVDRLVTRLPGRAWGHAAWVVLESPFLGGFRNAIGWLILFFGLQQAWRLTRAVPMRLTGPFGVSDASAR